MMGAFNTNKDEASDEAKNYLESTGFLFENMIKKWVELKEREAGPTPQDKVHHLKALHLSLEIELKNIDQNNGRVLAWPDAMKEAVNERIEAIKGEIDAESTAAFEYFRSQMQTVDSLTDLEKVRELHQNLSQFYADFIKNVPVFGLDEKRKEQRTLILSWSEEATSKIAWLKKSLTEDIVAAEPSTPSLPAHMETQETKMDYAAFSGDTAAIKSLIKGGFNVNAKLND
ncbi:MAG: hypothetical protein QG632_705, partial [Candidatus Dependentiae bacterium]|nr:hypothetical protein [Candidatus Dependentiae bacterium]